jgi:flagellar biosynthesis anti-sigma factor FlgM
MRIGLYNSTASELTTELSSQQAAQNGAKTGQVESEDRTTLSSNSTSVGSLVSKALESPEVRQDKVQSLRQSINSGEYELDPDKIASSILDQYA